MVERLQKYREPAVLVLLVVLALRVLLGVVLFLFLARGSADDALASGSRGAYGANSFALASFGLSSSVLDQVSAVVLVVLVASCWRTPPTPRARLLTLWSQILLLVAIVLAGVCALLWWASVPASPAAVADFVRLVLALVLPALGVVALRALSAAEPLKEMTPAAAELTPGAAAEPQGRPELAAPTRQENAPTWQPEHASGAAWLTAGDAARGAAASGWGTSADRGGWVPESPEAPSAGDARAH